MMRRQLLVFFSLLATDIPRSPSGAIPSKGLLPGFGPIPDIRLTAGTRYFGPQKDIFKSSPASSQFRRRPHQVRFYREPAARRT